MIWLIGSEGVKHYLKDEMYRPCSDIDIMCTPDDLMQIEHSLKKKNIPYVLRESPAHLGKYKLFIDNKAVYEIDATDNASRVFLTESYNEVKREVVDLPFINSALVPSLDMLYAIKLSHAGLPIHTEKTMLDLIRIGKILFGDKAGCPILNQDEQKLFQMLKEEAEARDAKRKARINFNKPAEDFFKQSANFREYTHDKVHDVTCRWDKPLFRENLKYEDRALIDMDLFMSRDLEYRLTMVQEESWVLGIERYFMNDRSLTSLNVYKKGVTKLIRDLSKGRFQDFMLTHMHLLAEPRWNALDKFLKAESSGFFSMPEQPPV